jgi:amino acid transporter
MMNSPDGPKKTVRNELFRRKTVEGIIRESGQERMEAVHGASLKRALTTRDLTAFGIAAIIGAGIFSMVGQASFDGGPAVCLLFVFIAVACGFTACCYAEFASLIPISGSAYTYAYASFGELIAWIIGWDLLLEYAIGNIAIAISWSSYLVSFLAGFGINIPAWMTMDFLTASRAHLAVEALLRGGQPLAKIWVDNPDLKTAYDAWTSAPVLGPCHVVANLPALFITILATWLVYTGIKESRNATNVMVGVKLAVLLAVILIGLFYVHPHNWSNFMPNGLTGVLKGTAAVFWAFIGFDAISTTAEECQQPQRDIPRGIFWSLIICTVVYVAVAIVLTGMVSYKELNLGDPLAYIFKDRLPWFGGLVALTALFAIASAFLVYQYGQPRIWMSMSRDGLLPPIFSRIHPKHHTPSFSTIVTGLMVAIPALFMNLREVVDLSSIGTLFAFILVCGGILVLDHSKNPPKAKFKTPYVNSRYIVPLLYCGALVILYRYFKKDVWDPFFSMAPSANESGQIEAGWTLFQHKIPMICFFLAATVLAALCFAKKLSLIPVLGLLSCVYLTSQLGVTNWARFFFWQMAGMAIFFLYSRKASKLISHKNHADVEN